MGSHRPVPGRIPTPSSARAPRKGLSRWRPRRFFRSRPLRHIAVVTTSRADYSHLYWVLKDLAASPALRLSILTGAAHLDDAFGATAQELRADGFTIAHRFACLSPLDDDIGMATTIGQACQQLAQQLGALRPDLVLLIADRYEMLAPAVGRDLRCASPWPTSRAATSARAPSTTTVRNALTKTQPRALHAHRDWPAGACSPWARSPGACTASGAPSLDHLAAQSSYLDRRRRSQVRTRRAPLAPDDGRARRLPPRHPRRTTRRRGSRRPPSPPSNAAIEAPLRVVLHPNADAGSRRLIERARALTVHAAAGAITCTSSSTSIRGGLLGPPRANAACHARQLLERHHGEPPPWRCPRSTWAAASRAANAARNVIDTPAQVDAMLSALARALDPAFRASLRGIPNPYGDGAASRRILEVLTTLGCREQLLAKAAVPPVPEASAEHLR
jgi:hypothetical protein